jgi:hypothetical protein
VFTTIDHQRAVEISAALAQSQEENNVSVVDHLAGLTETERSAAQLGVSPDEWKPISFMNKGHYDTLVRENALSGGLAQKLEAYKLVASGQ